MFERDLLFSLRRLDRAKGLLTERQDRSICAIRTESRTLGWRVASRLPGRKSTFP
jgi:hypothetical protein